MCVPKEIFAIIYNNDEAFSAFNSEDEAKDVHEQLEFPCVVQRYVLPPDFEVKRIAENKLLRENIG